MIQIDVSQPIYQQIVDGIIRRVVRSESRLGDQIPSQREMAELLRVSPNTVQRAYRDLEAMGLVETQRGQGTFVSAGAELVNALRQRMLDQALQRFTDELLALGFGKEELPQIAQRSLAVAVQGKSDPRTGDGEGTVE